MDKPSGHVDRLGAVQSLTSLSALDWMYADHYLHRAEELLTPICSRQRFHALQEQLSSLPAVTCQMRTAVEHDDWRLVELLAERGALLSAQLGPLAPVIPLARSVYASPPTAGAKAALLLAGNACELSEEQRSTCERVLERLCQLAYADPECAGFYRARAAYFESVRGWHTNGRVDHANPDRVLLRREIGAATLRGDFQRVREVARLLSDGGTSAAAGRANAIEPCATAAAQLCTPIPPGAIPSARNLGLATVTLGEVGSYNRYLVTADDNALDSRLRENFDLLLEQTFVTSAGARYLPWFGAETLLIEDFAETDSTEHTRLLDLLEIGNRRGVSRSTIENALRMHSVGICRVLGLDPAWYCVTCIPFDAYLRLAPAYGWGQLPLWTHFDGYRVTSRGDLLALVGGNSGYGGAHDLCEVERLYDAAPLLARFAVIRRLRLAVRQLHGGGPDGAVLSRTPEAGN